MRKSCPHCRADLPEEASFCLSCFTRLTTTQHIEPERISISALRAKRVFRYCNMSGFVLLILFLLFSGMGSLKNHFTNPIFGVRFTPEVSIPSAAELRPSFSPLKSTPSPAPDHTFLPTTHTPLQTVSFTAAPSATLSPQNSPTLPIQTPAPFEGIPEAPISDFTYTQCGESIRIDRYTGSAGVVRIPANIKGLPVTEIADHAFSKNSTLLRVQIPQNVRQIGAYVFFECKKLELVEMADSVREIGEYAFAECQALSSVRLSPHIQIFAPGLFSACGALIRLELPADLIELNLSAFADTSITDLTFPPLLMVIYEFQEMNMPKLENIFLSPGNTAFRSIDGVLFTDDQRGLLIYPANRSAASYTIPSGTIYTDYFSCRNNKHLCSVVLPEGMEKISGSTFYGCEKLKEVDLPDSLITIGEYAFSKTAVEKIVLPPNLAILEEGAFSDCKSLKDVYFPANIDSFIHNAFDGTPPDLVVQVAKGSQEQAWAEKYGISYKLY